MHDKHRHHRHRHKLAEIRRKQYNRKQRKRFFIVFIITAAIAGIMVGMRQCTPGGAVSPGTAAPGSLKDLNKLKKQMDNMGGGQKQMKEMLRQFQKR